ncbi:hypothetical protein AURDEDRAFT_177755 [Auricularia subglabra TFB-10046 SS5]|uniref:Uncharacterized protein n=1 Tax=Auricularia subglabra (strain TFB-10046 / SS5) TaxID=717982 RepID=J0CSB8_AURST|nr:hypothetical protein AURDEDRAFT_177755 [Auricularia subglabra TFB-10046 SS5]
MRVPTTCRWFDTIVWIIRERVRPFTRPATPEPAPTSPQPVSLDDQSSDRLYPSAAELQVLQENLNHIFYALRQPQGLRLKLSERMSLFLLPLYSFAQDLRQAKPNGAARRNGPMMQPPTPCF